VPAASSVPRSAPSYPGQTRRWQQTRGTAWRSTVSLVLLEKTFNRADQLGVVRLDLRAEALHLLAAAVDEILVEIPLRRFAGCLGEVRIERIGLQAGLGEHRKVDRVLVDAEARNL